MTIIRLADTKIDPLVITVYARETLVSDAPHCRMPRSINLIDARGLEIWTFGVVERVCFLMAEHMLCDKFEIIEDSISSDSIRRLSILTFLTQCDKYRNQEDSHT